MTFRDVWIKRDLNRRLLAGMRWRSPTKPRRDFTYDFTFVDYDVYFECEVLIAGGVSMVGDRLTISGWTLRATHEGPMIRIKAETADFQININSNTFLEIRIDPDTGRLYDAVVVEPRMS